MTDGELYRRPGEKMFIVRKYIMAKSAQQAIKKDKTTPVDDVYISEDWKEKKLDRLEGAIGFQTDSDGYYGETSKK